jgi:hypothetical protein
VFQEEQQARSQEFLVRWSPDGGQSYREIVRQQHNFSPRCIPIRCPEVDRRGPSK